MRSKVLLFLLLAYALSSTPYVYAEYVLPYPSYMPGNKLYKISRLTDQLKQWWYWGTIAQTKYHLMLADKYLVEAKTLFEYKQYLLAIAALKDSDKHFQIIPVALHKAASDGKDVTSLTKLVEKAADKHVAALLKLKNETPRDFVWSPEKSAATTLSIWQALDVSIAIRQSPK